MPTIPYDHLRALELEGRHPADAGVWPITLRRVEAGEGIPLPFDPDHTVEVPTVGPLPSAPVLPPARRKRSFYHRRVRSAAAAEHLIRAGKMVTVALEMFTGWQNPAEGVVPLPTAEERPLDFTHVIALGACDAERRRFAFRNSWGESWGKHGCGFLPADYLDAHAIAAWVTYAAVHVELSKVQRGPGRQEGRWTARDEWYRRVYGFEVWDESGKDRRAWAFVVEQDGTLDVEDCYVRPEFRGQGHGRYLADRLGELSRGKSLPLRLWVPYADCRQESPATYPALLALVRRLGLRFQPCPVRWAAYLAGSAETGETEPIEPVSIPPRPRLSLSRPGAR